MRLEIYPLLNLRSKRAITRRKKRWGHPYIYEPKQILVTRLSRQLNKSEDEIRRQIELERQFLLENDRYY